MTSAEAIEREAQDALREALKEHRELAEKVARLIGRTFELFERRRWPEIPLPEQVGLCLLVRLLNDLRCTVLLADRGYGLQAVTIAGSIYEAAFAIGYIGAAQDLANAWVDHDDPLKTLEFVVPTALCNADR